MPIDLTNLLPESKLVAFALTLIILTAVLASSLEPLGVQVGVRDNVDIGITVVLLLAALYVILSKEYEPADKHWAFGVVGTITGYWFRAANQRRK